MNDGDFDREFEALVRAGLERTIRPPATPQCVRDRLESLIEREMASTRVRRRGWPRPAWPAKVSNVAFAAIVVALVAVASLLLATRAPEIAGPTQRSASPAPTSRETRIPSSLATTPLGLGWMGGLNGYLVATESATRPAWSSVRMTSDGGISWSEPRALPVLVDSATGIDFVDSRHGFVLLRQRQGNDTEVVLYRTADGARTWQRAVVTTLTNTGKDLQNVYNTHFADVSNGVVLVTRFAQGPSGSDTVISYGCQRFSTSDGGQAWSIGGAPCLDQDVTWATRSIGLIQEGTQIVSTSDGGRTWRSGRLPALPPGREFEMRLFQADTPGLLTLYGLSRPVEGGVLGPAIEYQSSDSGLSWSQVFADDSMDGKLTEMSVSEMSPNHWMAIIEPGIAPGPSVTIDQMMAQPFALLLSTDAGRHWSRMPSTNLTEVSTTSWADDLHGALLGWRLADCPTRCLDTVFLTDDGGRTWRPVSF